MGIPGFIFALGFSDPSQFKLCQPAGSINKLLTA